MQLPGLAEIESAAELVYQSMQASPQLSWPLLNERLGCEAWIKHENQNPTGAFKVRGGLIYLNRLVEKQPGIRGICAATRGNHGQSAAFAAALHGLRVVIVVPEGNSPDKNVAMQAFGAELIVHGKDFDVALEHARQLAADQDLHFMPSIDGDLIPGVATYALEFFQAAPALDRIYVPIGLGSGVLGVIAAKRALNLDTEIVGVVSAHANTYQLSLAAGEPVGTESADTIADGLAVRNASAEALAVIRDHVSRIAAVDDVQVMQAMGCYFADTHNVAEGAGAAPLAAALQDQDIKGKRVGIVLTGGNVNRALFTKALSDIVE